MARPWAKAMHRPWAKAMHRLWQRERRRSQQGCPAMVRQAATSFAANILPIIRQIEATGATSYHAIADALNARGVRTARGGEWYSGTVRNLMLRDEPR